MTRKYGPVSPLRHGSFVAVPPLPWGEAWNGAPSPPFPKGIPFERPFMGPQKGIKPAQPPWPILKGHGGVFVQQAAPLYFLTCPMTHVMGPSDAVSIFCTVTMVRISPLSLAALDSSPRGEPWNGALQGAIPSWRLTISTAPGTERGAAPCCPPLLVTFLAEQKSDACRLQKTPRTLRSGGWICRMLRYRANAVTMR